MTAAPESEVLEVACVMGVRLSHVDISSTWYRVALRRVA